MKSLKYSLAVISILLAGCNAFQPPTRVVSAEEQPPIKMAAEQFIQAMAAGDETAIAKTITVDADPATRKLAAAVIKDTATARRLNLELAKRFDETESSRSVVGSDDWLTLFQDVTETATMLQADRRARIGDETTDGVLFFRLIDGTWKVEIVPTLVAESGGRAKVSDPIVDYRFNFTAALNEMMLERLNNDEFTSYRDYMKARNQFWMQFMALTANGEDPQDKLLSTLPIYPKDAELTARLP